MKPDRTLADLRTLEELAEGNTVLHRLHPGAKLLAAFLYLICLMSLERHALVRVTPFLFYPVLMGSIAELPAGLLFRRTVPALPFAFFAGLSNLVFEGGTAGALSFTVLMIRTFLCVSAVMILIGTTPFPALTGAMKQFHVPAVIADLLEMLYGYLSVVTEEAEQMLTAFRLRSCGRVWPAPREYAPMISQLFFRSADRAERIYDAMQCRLYRGAGTLSGTAGKWKRRDYVFFLLSGGASVLFAAADIPGFLGSIAR